MSASNISVCGAHEADETFCRAMDDDLENHQSSDADFAMSCDAGCPSSERPYQPAGDLRLKRIFLKIPYISCITVLPEFRRQGVGKSLLLEMVKTGMYLGS
jgi:ribosomal protein S18 acetylase RimI-like enzyme